jgi:hypothetical protein
LVLFIQGSERSSLQQDPQQQTGRREHAAGAHSSKPGHAQCSWLAVLHFAVNCGSPRRGFAL